MKAAVFRQFGDVDVLQYEDVEMPRPGPGEVVVKVLAAAQRSLEQDGHI